MSIPNSKIQQSHVDQEDKKSTESNVQKKLTSTSHQLLETQNILRNIVTMVRHGKLGAELDVLLEAAEELLPKKINKSLKSSDSFMPRVPTQETVKLLRKTLDSIFLVAGDKGRVETIVRGAIAAVDVFADSEPIIDEPKQKNPIKAAK
jgi:hypothetical protein